ncbi:MAG TPA: hypothetical protein DEA73_05325 [Peptococcaceae bacterium]|nr:hypothetical protein [Peptococcaceae bacterium]
MVQGGKEYTPFEDGRASPGQGGPQRREGGTGLTEGPISLQDREGKEPPRGDRRHRQPTDFPQGKIGSGIMATPGGQPLIEAEAEGEG